MVGWERLLKTYASLKSGALKLTPEDYIPTFHHERWHKPLLNKAKLNYLRKMALRDGLDLESLGIPEKEPTRTMPDLPPQGRISERLRPFK